MVARGFNNFRCKGNCLWHKGTERISLSVQVSEIPLYSSLHMLQKFTPIVLVVLKIQHILDTEKPPKLYMCGTMRRHIKNAQTCF